MHTRSDALLRSLTRSHPYRLFIGKTFVDLQQHRGVHYFRSLTKLGTQHAVGHRAVV